MTKQFFSTMIALAIFVGVFGLLRFANADEAARDTTTTVGNQAPIITVTPSDGASNSGTAVGDPTTSGSDVTFTVTAKDINTDDYYAAFCSSDAITGGSSGAPTCADAAHTWVVSGATNSDAEISGTTYTTGSNSAAEGADCVSNEECVWYAFACDDAATGLCFPANGSGDQGSAIGTVTFADVPVDQAVLTVDSATYEFDNGGSCTTTPTACINTATLEDGADAAAAVAAAEAGANSTMYARGAVVYVYADAYGVGGNSIGMTDTGDTGDIITFSDSVLAGGSDDNATPFAINHPPVFVSYGVGDTQGTSTVHSSGSIEPGETVWFSVAITDADVEDAQDTVNMYVCANGNTYVPGTGCSGTEICSDLAVDPTAEYAKCSNAAIASVPTANATYDVEVFIEDQHHLTNTTWTDEGSAARQYAVTDTAPYLDTTYGSSGYTATDSPAPSAGDSDTVDFYFGIKDDNGDNDITNGTGVFFDDSTTSACSSDENLCYYDTTCTLDDVSSPGSGKTADGTDNTATASCQVTVWFNATAGDWDVAGYATDAADEEGPFTDASSSLSVPSLQGIDVVTATIAYGTVAIGGTSSGQETSIGNVGNQLLDVQITGTDMSDGATHTIVAAQQKWHSTSAAFDWDAAAADPGPWVLLESAGSTLYNEEEGCANRDIAVRETNASTATNESVFWKIRIPASQAAGAYTGSNTFTSTADSTCSGASAH